MYIINYVTNVTSITIKTVQFNCTFYIQYKYKIFLYFAVTHILLYIIRIIINVLEIKTNTHFTVNSFEIAC